jgi:hypothetical protein
MRRPIMSVRLCRWGPKKMIRGDWSSDSSGPGAPGQDELPAHAADVSRFAGR